MNNYWSRRVFKEYYDKENDSFVCYGLLIVMILSMNLHLKEYHAIKKQFQNSWLDSVGLVNETCIQSSCEPSD